MASLDLYFRTPIPDMPPEHVTLIDDSSFTKPQYARKDTLAGAGNPTFPTNGNGDSRYRSPTSAGKMAETLRYLTSVPTRPSAARTSTASRGGCGAARPGRADEGLTEPSRRPRRGTTR